MTFETKTPRDLFESYAGSVAYLSVRLPDGSCSIGTAFHVGENIWLTARHVVDGNSIEEVANTVSQHHPDAAGSTFDSVGGVYRTIRPTAGKVVRGPFFHPDKHVDVAALVIEGIDCPAIPLGSHLDDWINDEAFVLMEVVVMGYPPVPQSSKPVLVAARAEVNAVIDKYSGPHPHFVVSSMARGGFSGGPCLTTWDFTLGMVTESLVSGDSSVETGFLTVLSVEPLLVCLGHNGLLTAAHRGEWGDLFDVRD